MSPKGLISGDVKVYDDKGLLADYSLGAESSTLMPSQSSLFGKKIDELEEMRCVVVVKKDTVRKLKDFLPIPKFYCLVDCSPSRVHAQKIEP